MSLTIQGLTVHDACSCGRAYLTVQRRDETGPETTPGQILSFACGKCGVAWERTSVGWTRAACDPPNACVEHGRCWTHSTEDKCDCGSNDFTVSATLIKCKACGRLWGRVNGTWVLDTTTVPNAKPVGRDGRLRIYTDPVGFCYLQDEYDKMPPDVQKAMEVSEWTRADATAKDAFVAELKSLPTTEARIEALRDVLDKCCRHCGSFSEDGGELLCPCTNDE